MYLILNADDFGLTRAINESVRELAEIGILSSTTVMVNMPFANDIDQFVDLNNFGIGLHFNLTQGNPISNPSEIVSIVNEFGEFFTVQELKLRIKEKKVIRAHVLREMKAQYDWLYNKVGNKLTHIDSHQDINKIKYISDILIEFSYGLKYKHGLRVYNKSYLSVSNGKFKIENPGLINLFTFGLRRCMVEIYFRYTNRTLKKYYTLPDGMLLTKDNCTRGLLKTLTLLNSTNYDRKCYEIMCHPSKSIVGLSKTKFLQSRVEEYELLKSARFQRFIKQTKLLNFSELNK